MQQYLIPHRIGDERLLIPGWAGELTDPELAFIEERLRRSRRLSKQWGITDRDYSEQRIRQSAALVAVKVVIRKRDSVLGE